MIGVMSMPPRLGMKRRKGRRAGSVMRPEKRQREHARTHVDLHESQWPDARDRAECVKKTRYEGHQNKGQKDDRCRSMSSPSRHPAPNDHRLPGSKCHDCETEDPVDDPWVEDQVHPYEIDDQERHEYQQRLICPAGHGPGHGPSLWRYWVCVAGLTRWLPQTVGRGK